MELVSQSVSQSFSQGLIIKARSFLLTPTPHPADPEVPHLGHITPVKENEVDWILLAQVRVQSHFLVVTAIYLRLL
jgi:hypothetical protein